MLATPTGRATDRRPWTGRAGLPPSLRFGETRRSLGGGGQPRRTLIGYEAAMSIAQALLPEFDYEMALTRALLERVPDRHAAWRPHPTSRELGQLAVHIASLPSWVMSTLERTELDLNPPGGAGDTPPVWESARAAVSTFDTAVKAARSALLETSDADMLVPWTLKHDGREIFRLPRLAVVRSMVLSHLVHHRGQLTVYLRLHDVPLPAMYRPERRHGSVMRAWVSAAIACVAVMTGGPGIDGQGANPPHRFLFSYFTGNGEDGLHLASSADGLVWTPLQGGRSLLTPTVGSKLMRDPSIVLGPDDRFHMVWTTGWWDKGIGVAHSSDLVTWSEPREIPVMAHEPAALNAWAPELFYDAPAGRYLIVWATTIPGRFHATDETGNVEKQGKLNHRLYCVTTKDFTTYTPAKLFFDDGFNVIDGTLVETAPARFALVVKDETQRPVPRKHLRVAFGQRAEGPFGPASAAISPDWVEGPSVLRVDGAWLLYFDEYTRKRYGALRSTDFVAWTSVSDRVRFPEGARHGTAFVAPRAVIERLRR